jgi:hypothetical protein
MPVMRREGLQGDVHEREAAHESNEERCPYGGE